MHEPVKWPCIFGCLANDEIRHYLVCHVLWQLASEKLGSEVSILVGERLCLIEPSVQKLRMIALCHFIYHSCKHDDVCASGMTHFCTNSGVAPPWPVVQNRAIGFAKVGYHLVQ